MFPGFSCGTNFLTSSLCEKSVDAVTFPDRSPLAMGENGTTPIPFSMQNGMISRSRSRSTME